MRLARIFSSLSFFASVASTACLFSVFACTTENPNGSGDGSETQGCVDGDLGCPCDSDFSCEGDLVCSDESICVESNAVCGDGKVEGAEECDAGGENADDAACKSDCTAASCGDGFVGPDEACDDGNDENDDACTVACLAPACGDGFLQAGEDCDDENGDETDACLSTCVAASCGDGEVWAEMEDCDDENDEARDACSNLCFATTFASCGNDEDDEGEICYVDGSPVQLPGQSAFGPIYAEDLNADGNSDLILSPDENSIVYLLGNGDGTFDDPEAIDPLQSAITWFLVRDLDLDGQPDLLTVNGEGKFSPAWGNAGEADFFDVQLIPISPLTDPSVYHLKVDDVNGDGRPDVLYASTQHIGVWRQTTPRLFSGDDLYTPNLSPVHVSAVDLDGQGDATVVLVEPTPTTLVGVAPPPEENMVRFAYPGVPTPGHASVAWLGADLFGDAGEELVTGMFPMEDRCETFEQADCTRASIFIYEGDGGEDVDIATATVLPDSGLRPAIMRTFDPDGDGDQDILVYDNLAQHVHIYRNLGDGAFSTPLLFPVSIAGDFAQLDLGDFNGDDIDDVAILSSEGNVRLLLSSN